MNMSNHLRVIKYGYKHYWLWNYNHLMGTCIIGLAFFRCHESKNKLPCYNNNNNEHFCAAGMHQPVSQPMVSNMP